MLIELLTYNEVDEKNFKHLLVRIQEKMRKLEYGTIKIVNFEDNYQYNIFEKVALFFHKKKKSDTYIRKRTIRICIWRALNELKIMKEIDF